MFYFYENVFESHFFTTLLILIPILNGIACCFIFKTILKKIALGILLASITSYLNFWAYYALYFFLYPFLLEGEALGSETPFFNLIHSIISLLVCGGFCFLLYVIGARSIQKRSGESR